MKERYSWKKIPNNYASYYNEVDLFFRKKFIIIDNITGMEYEFPVYEKKKDENGYVRKVRVIHPDLWNQEFFNWICSTSPDFCIDLPSEFMTPELIDICINNTSKKDFILQIPNLTQDNCTRFVERFPNAIVHFPSMFITKEICEKSVKGNPDNISNVPRSFQIFEIQRLAIDQNYRCIFKIHDDCLGDEIIEYTLKINGLALGAIPMERRSKKWCEMAVENNPKALRHTPNKYKTYKMCKSAVMRFPELIKVVPPDILSREFFNELQELGVIIPERFMGYVRECISAHDKMDIIAKYIYEPQNIDLNLSKTEMPIELNNINVNDLSTLFSPQALKHFEEYEISNLEQLFTFARSKKFINYFGKYAIFDELNNTIKLLRCKYLNEDPLIDITDDGMDFNELYKMLGLSNGSSNALKRANFCQNAKEFFEKMQEEDIAYQLKDKNCLGNSRAREILEKANIVINYHKKKNMVQNEDLSDDELLKSLNGELQRLLDARKIIDDRIDFILARKQEIKLNQAKGGIKK